MVNWKKKLYLSEHMKHGKALRPAVKKLKCKTEQMKIKNDDKL